LNDKMRAFVASEFPFSGRREGLTSFFLIFFCALKRRSELKIYADSANYTDPSPQIRSTRNPVLRSRDMLPFQRRFNRFVTAIIRDTIARESRVKQCSRAKKITLITHVPPV